MFFLCVHSNILVEGHFLSKIPYTESIPSSPQPSTWVSKFFFFKILLILRVGYKIRIIQDVKLVNMLPPSWEVLPSEVILHVCTRVQWKVLISWMLFCVIVLLPNSCLNWLPSAWSSIIHRRSCRYSQPGKWSQIAKYFFREFWEVVVVKMPV